MGNNIYQESADEIDFFTRNPEFTFIAGEVYRNFNIRVFIIDLYRDGFYNDKHVYGFDIYDPNEFKSVFDSMDINPSGYADCSTALKNGKAKIDSILDGSKKKITDINIYQESVDDEDDFQNIGKDEYRDVNIFVFTVNDQGDLRIWIYIN